jgi:flagellar biosynthesis regulator FlbT
MKDKLVTLVTYRYQYRAEILQDKLEEAEIKCSISNESILGQIDGVKVMVMDREYAKALKVYRNVRKLYDNHSNEVVEEPKEDIE